MKKRVWLYAVLMIMFCIIFCGCSSNKKTDIKVSQYKYYINNSDHWDIASYNNYICKEYEILENDDGSYTIAFVFDTIHKN